MDKIITDIYKIMKDSSNPIKAEEEIQSYMWLVLSEAMQEIFSTMNQVLKEKKQSQGWKVERMMPEPFNTFLDRFNINERL